MRVYFQGHLNRFIHFCGAHSHDKETHARHTMSLQDFCSSRPHQANAAMRVDETAGDDV